MSGPFDQLWDSTTRGMRSWYEAKMFIEHASVVSSDALHVLVGTLVWLVAAIAVRRPLSAWLPWLAVLLLALLNEAVDLSIEHWPHPGEQYGETAKDLVLTMLMPTALMLAVRLRPTLFRAPPRR